MLTLFLIINPLSKIIFELMYHEIKKTRQKELPRFYLYIFHFGRGSAYVLQTAFLPVCSVLNVFPFTLAFFLGGYGGAYILQTYLSVTKKVTYVSQPHSNGIKQSKDCVRRVDRKIMPLSIFFDVHCAKPMPAARL